MALSAEERSRINRENGSKSKGPVTEEGKQRSRMNAFRHGLSGQFLVLHPDDTEAWRANRREYILAYRPVGREEEMLCDLLADTAWLISHANAIELNARAFATVALDQPKAPPIDPLAVACADHFAHVLPNRHKRQDPRGPALGASSLEWIGRHRSRLERTFYKTRQELKIVQKQRIAEAADERKIRSYHGANYNPAICGPFNNDVFDEAASPALQLLAQPVADAGQPAAAEIRSCLDRLQSLIGEEKTQHLVVEWVNAGRTSRTDTYADGSKTYYEGPVDSDEYRALPTIGQGSPNEPGTSPAPGTPTDIIIPKPAASGDDPKPEDADDDDPDSSAPGGKKLTVLPHPKPWSKSGTPATSEPKCKNEPKLAAAAPPAETQKRTESAAPAPAIAVQTETQKRTERRNRKQATARAKAKSARKRGRRARA